MYLQFFVQDEYEKPSKEHRANCERRFSEINNNIKNYTDQLQDNYALHKRIIIPPVKELEDIKSFIYKGESESIRNLIFSIFCTLEEFVYDDVRETLELLKGHFERNKPLRDDSTILDYQINAVIIYHSIIGYLKYLDTGAIDQIIDPPKREQKNLSEKVLLLSKLGFFNDSFKEYGIEDQGRILSFLLDGSKDNLAEMARCVNDKRHSNSSFNVYKSATRDKLIKKIEGLNISKLNRLLDKINTEL